MNDFISRGARISAGIKASLYDIGVGGIADVNANKTFGDTLSRLGFGLDAGLTYDFSETIRIGGVYKNIIAPNVSILQGGNDTLASEFRLGGNWDIGDLLFLKKSKVGGGIVVYNRGGLTETNKQALNDNRQSEMSYNVGFEFRQLSLADFLKASPYKGELLTIRLGGIYQSRTAPLESIITITGGLGFVYVIGKEHKLNLDYVMEYGLNEGSLKQSVGLTYEFMLPNSAFAYKEEVRKELEFEELINKKAEVNVLPEMKEQTNILDTSAETNKVEEKKVETTKKPTIKK